MKLRCSGQERVALTFPPAKSKSGKPGQSSGVAGDFFIAFEPVPFQTPKYSHYESCSKRDFPVLNITFYLSGLNIQICCFSKIR